jgi:Ca-activated chloride channel family protein
MNRTRVVFLFVVVAAAAVAGGALMLGPRWGHEPTGGAATTVPTAEETVDVVVASASTKQRWIEDVAARFNAGKSRTASGKPIRIVPVPVLSGGSLEDILQGKLKPAAWSPGAQSWVQELDAQWQGRTGSTLTSGACRPTITTPFGLAMWRPMAEALGWPGRKVSWKTIIDLAADPAGWATLGHPEWGRFRLGYPHPGYSNVGMLFMASVVYGVRGKTMNLEPAEIYGDDVRKALAALAQNTSKYGLVSVDLLDAMAAHGPQFLHAVAAFENDTVQYNVEKAEQLRFPLAFVIPAEGTFWADQPYCVLDKADWVTQEQAEGARMFLDYLLQPDQQVLALNSGLRPLDAAVPLREPLDLEHGTDPGIVPGIRPSLEAPSGDTMRAIADLFLITKRKATVLIVLDVSGSMDGEKMRAATTSTVNFIKRLHPQDIVGLETFSDSVRTLFPPRPVAEVAEDLEKTVADLISEGGTALNAATCQAMKTMEEQRTADEAASLNRLYGIVLLTDGNDTTGGISENEMMTTCLPSDAESAGIRIYPIAFGADADTAILDRIAKVTGGRMFRADPDSIERIYVSVSAEQ